MIVVFYVRCEKLRFTFNWGARATARIRFPGTHHIPLRKSFFLYFQILIISTTGAPKDRGDREGHGPSLDLLGTTLARPHCCATMVTTMSNNITWPWLSYQGHRLTYTVQCTFTILYVIITLPRIYLLLTLALDGGSHVISLTIYFNFQLVMKS